MTAFRASLERLLHRIWYENHWLAWLLIPLSRLVEWEVARRASRRPPKGATPSGVAVWVIGGLTVGGTGKTPVLIALGEWLRHQGVSIGVISRGYRGRLGKEAHLVSGADSAEDVGDEPLEIQRRLDCPVVICRDRVQALRVMVEQFDVDVVLSDDGLQHSGLPRDLEVVVLDAERGLGNGRLIPAGPLREPASRLALVDWVLERNSKDPDRCFAYQVASMRQLSTGNSLSWAQWCAQWGRQPITAMTALGQPGQFFEMLGDLGLDVTGIALPDHAAISQEQLKKATTERVLITSKDAVKLEAMEASDVGHRIWVVEIKTRLPTALLTKLAQALAAN